MSSRTLGGYARLASAVADPDAALGDDVGAAGGPHDADPESPAAAESSERGATADPVAGAQVFVVRVQQSGAEPGARADPEEAHTRFQGVRGGADGGRAATVQPVRLLDPRGLAQLDGEEVQGPDGQPHEPGDGAGQQPLPARQLAERAIGGCQGGDQAGTWNDAGGFFVAFLYTFMDFLITFCVL